MEALSEICVCNHPKHAWAVCWCASGGGLCGNMDVHWPGPTAFHLASLPGRGRVAHDDNGQQSAFSFFFFFFFPGRPAASSSRTNLDHVGRRYFLIPAVRYPHGNVPHPPPSLMGWQLLMQCRAAPRQGRVPVSPTPQASTTGVQRRG